MTRPLDERFLERVAIPRDVLSGCWLWTGRIATGGYGQYAGWSSHRYAWTLLNGPIPEGGPGFHGFCVLHRCDVRRCVNPTHLFLGTHEENIADKVAKGRQARGPRRHPEKCARGEGHGRAKLTEADVRRMIELRAGGLGFQSIADLFGVVKSTAIAAIKGRHWSHVCRTGDAT